MTVEQEIDYGDIRVEAVDAPPEPLVLETAVPSENAVKENAFNNRFAPKAAEDAAPVEPPPADPAPTPAAEAAPSVKTRRRRTPVGEAPPPELPPAMESPSVVSPEQGGTPQ